MKRVRKIIGWLAALTLVVVGALVALLFVGVGPTVKTAVNTFGPKLLGAPVTLQNAEFSILRGEIKLTGLHIGNPPGYDTKSMFDAPAVMVEVDALSLFGTTIHVRKIFFEEPQITYELGKESNNIRDVLNNLNGVQKGSTNTSTKTTGEPGPAVTNKPTSTNAAVIAAKKGQRYIIDEFVIQKPRIGASITGAEGRQLAIKLGEINIKDIGKAQGGVTADEAVKAIVADLTHRVEEESAGIVGSLKNTARDLKKSAAPLLETLKGLFGGGKKDKDKKKTDKPPTP